MTRARNLVYAADLGGTKLAAALADARGRLVAELTQPTDPRGARHVADQIAACAATLAQAQGLELTQLHHVMVGIPGAVDPRTHRISLVPHIAGLEDFDLLAYLGERFGTHVAIENDVNLAMVGEQALGCARDCRNAAFLALGTGVGLGLLLDGRLYRGASGSAGEIADLPIGWQCGDVGPKLTGSSFEREVGSRAILERYRRAGGADAGSVREIFERLQDGDGIAATVLDTTARCVAVGVATLQSLLDLERIVLGGSIGVRPELVQRIESALGQLLPRPVGLAVSEFGERAGLIGAAWAAGEVLRSVQRPEAH